MNNRICETRPLRRDIYKPTELLHIEQSHLAKPETVTMSHGLTPVSFDIYGHPNFDIGSTSVEIDTDIIVQYEIDPFTEPRENFDSVDGIRRHISSLEDLNQVLNLRRRFTLANPGIPLKHFLLWHYFWLDEHGDGASPIGNCETNILPDSEGVEDIQEFTPVFPLSEHGKGDCIPPAGMVCPHCGREIVITDLPCKRWGNEFYHSACSRVLGHFIYK